MATVNWTKAAYAHMYGSSSYSAERTASNSDAATLNPSSTNTIVSRYYQAAPRGTTTYQFGRSFFYFDVSSYTSGTVTNLYFHYTPTTTSSMATSNWLMKSTAFNAGGIISDYTSSEWWSSLNSMGTAYTAAWTVADSSTPSSVQMNSTAISSMTGGYLIFAMVNNLDKTGMSYPGDTNQTCYCNFSSGKFYIAFDYATAGYGNAVNAVPAASINRVIKLPSANIANVIGVP